MEAMTSYNLSTIHHPTYTFIDNTNVGFYNTSNNILQHNDITVGGLYTLNNILQQNAAVTAAGVETNRVITHFHASANTRPSRIACDSTTVSGTGNAAGYV